MGTYLSLLHVFTRSFVIHRHAVSHHLPTPHRRRIVRTTGVHHHHIVRTTAYTITTATIIQLARACCCICFHPICSLCFFLILCQPTGIKRVLTMLLLYIDGVPCLCIFYFVNIVFVFLRMSFFELVFLRPNRSFKLKILYYLEACMLEFRLLAFCEYMLC